MPGYDGLIAEAIGMAGGPSRGSCTVAQTDPALRFAPSEG